MSRPNGRLGLLRSLGAALGGYAAIIVATTLGFTPLGGIIHLSAPLRVHALATVVAIVSGILGGMVAGWIGGRFPVRHALGAAACVVIESSLIIGLRRGTDPLWFEVLGAATLVLATVSGGYLWGSLRRQPGKSIATASRS